MLGKLYKHEFHSLLRNLVPVYIGLAALAILSRLSFAIEESNVIITIFQIGVLLVYIFGAVAMFVLSMILTVIRFYKHLLSHEGYLTFSLPFKASQHLNCKLICGVVTMAINVAVLLISLTVFTVGTNFWSEAFLVIREAIKALVENAQAWKIVLFIAEFIIMIPLSLAQGLLMYYTCMAIGQQFKNRIAGAVVAYLCIYSALQIISLFVMIPLSIISPEIFEAATFTSGINLMLIYFGVILLYELVLGLAYYFVTRHLLTKKLNLE